MKISELFYSIQGEGKRAGMPSFFIRTNYCNLRCMFKSGNLCDTSYTSWYPDDDKNLGETSIESISDKYREFLCKDIVITGGEPTMYADELLLLCKKLKKVNNDSFITIETNGTFIGEFINYTDLISLSPKLKSSVPFDTPQEKMHVKSRLNLKVLRKYNSLYKAGKLDIQWKFVFTSGEDIKEIKSLQSEIRFKNENVFLMPEGVSEKDLKKTRFETVKACLENNYNYSDRLHILIWGNKRGV